MTSTQPSSGLRLTAGGATVGTIECDPQPFTIEYIAFSEAGTHAHLPQRESPRQCRRFAGGYAAPPSQHTVMAGPRGRPNQPPEDQRRLPPGAIKACIAASAWS